MVTQTGVLGTEVNKMRVHNKRVHRIEGSPIGQNIAVDNHTILRQCDIRFTSVTVRYDPDPTWNKC